MSTRQRILLGGTALFCGVAVYLLLRPAVAQVTAGGGWSLASSSWVMSVAGSSPTFFHVLAFSLLTGAAADVKVIGAALVSLAWVAINVAFEWGQRDDIARWLAYGINASCGGAWPCAVTSNYFLRGTFDVGDLLGGVAGGGLAYGLLYASVVSSKSSGE